MEYIGTIGGILLNFSLMIDLAQYGQLLGCITAQNLLCVVAELLIGDDSTISRSFPCSSSRMAARMVHDPNRGGSLLNARLAKFSGRCHKTD
jgi:hypothetical protein